MNLKPSRTFRLALISSFLFIMSDVFLLINQYTNDGPVALGFLYFLTGIIMLDLFIILIVDLVNKNHHVIQARLISKHGHVIYVLRSNGKVNKIKIAVPEILVQLVPEQQVEITLSSLTHIPLHIVSINKPQVAPKLRSFDHIDWANHLINKALQVCNGSVEKPLRLLAHILAAEKVWLARINGEDAAAISIWPEYTLEQCEHVREHNKIGYQTFLSQLKEADFTKIISYQNSKGIAFNTTISDILTHVSLHGSYHRGQIAALLRQAGEAMVNTDYIAYVRQLEIE
ncbi:hypothetical protein ASG81_18930 [Paenibacillus sp. Soil522]|nr:hypothetical protein ASG81_18930 [Paenibacillus sp. Soil522]